LQKCFSNRKSESGNPEISTQGCYFTTERKRSVPVCYTAFGAINGNDRDVILWSTRLPRAAQQLQLLKPTDAVRTIKLPSPAFWATTKRWHQLHSVAFSVSFVSLSVSVFLLLFNPAVWHQLVRRMKECRRLLFQWRQLHSEWPDK